MRGRDHAASATIRPSRQAAWYAACSIAEEPMPHARHAALVLVLTAGCFTADNTAAPPGDLRKFDPIAGFAAIAAYAGPDARVVTMRASYVAIDGTLDLLADYHPRVEFEFVARATAEDAKAQGPQAPGSGFAVGDLLGTRLSVSAPGTWHVTSGNSEWDEKHLGMDRRPGSKASGTEKLAAAPTCSFAVLWQRALEQGAPRDVVANIDYDADGYTFAANGRDFRRKFAADCTLRPD
jgi:hypothetical protein